MPKKPRLTFYRVGSVERGTATARNPRPGYAWHDGYSTAPDGSSYPWLTAQEARAEAARDGMVADFREPTNSDAPDPEPHGYAGGGNDMDHYREGYDE